jgi:curved DNA-binding protein CbpA
MKNYYAILETHFEATEVDIKKSFRRCALKYHPDVNNSPDAHSKFLDVLEAYEVLSNLTERSIYNELYVKAFRNKNITISTTNEQFEERNKANRQKASEKAKSYSQMSHASFADYLTRELKLALTYAFPIGWALFLVIEGFASIYLIYFFLTSENLNDKDLGPKAAIVFRNNCHYIFCMGLE